MARKIFSGVLILLAAFLLVVSLGGIAALWVYNEPLTREVTRQLKEVDGEMAQAQTALQSSRKELERALRLVNTSEAALEKLAEQTEGAENIFEYIQSKLDDDLLPELKTTRQRIESARTALEGLQTVLEGISSFIPIVDLNAPDKILVDLIASARSLDSDIADIEVIAQQASTFVSDTSFLLGGDLSQTRESLEEFLATIQVYQEKVTDWRAQIKVLNAGLPKWIDQASIGLTIFLVWFALSQFGLILHGISIRDGDNPLWVLRRR